MNSRSNPVRVVSLLSAAATTTVLVASQFGIAGFYGRKAEAELASRRAAPLWAQRQPGAKLTEATVEMASAETVPPH